MRLWQLAGIEAGSWSRALALWLVLLAVTASGELGAETLRALLLDRAGSDALPPAFALEAVLKLTAIPAYFWLSRRFSNRQLMAVTIGLYAAVTALIALAPASLLSGWLVPAFALEAVAQNLLVLHWGVYLVDFFTVRESTSSFAFIYSAQPLGALVAGGLLIWHPFGRLADLIYVAAGLAAGGLVLAARAGRRLAESPRIQVGVGRGQTAEEGSGLGAACPAKPWRSGVGSGPEAPGAADPAAGTGGQASQRGEGRPVERSEPCRPGWLSRFAGPGRSRRDGTGGYPAWRYVLRAPVVRTMAVATAVMVLARSLLQVSGSHVLAEQFETEGRIGEFLGQYKLWTNVVVFAVQALGAARLMRQLSPP
ncbi:MAG: MFS transporter, partial [Deltaproteobacteria bacterium]|nr:MFS transporter [Deltaproteobacteria bacterium]